MITSYGTSDGDPPTVTGSSHRALGPTADTAARAALDPAAAVAFLRPADGPRTVFIAGKGGVGRTAISCAAAVQSAGEGYRTRLVTTDRVAHIRQVLGEVIESRPTRVPA